MRRSAFAALLCVGCAAPASRVDQPVPPPQVEAAQAPAAPAAPAPERPSALPAAAPQTSAVPAPQTDAVPAPRASPVPEPKRVEPTSAEDARAARALAARAKGRLKQRDFDGSLGALREAVALDPRLDALAPGETARRLEGILADIGWSLPARRAVLAPGAADKTRAEAAFAANTAIAAFAEGRDVEAMLFSAAAVGADPQTAVFRALNTGLSKRTGLVTPADELLPRGALVQLKLQRAEKAFLDDRYGEAARDSQQAVWLDPRNVLAWTRLGSSRWATGDKERALKAFHSALALDPENAEVRSFLASRKLPLPPPRPAAPSKTVDINSQ